MSALDLGSRLGEADEGLLETMKKLTASPLVHDAAVLTAGANLREHVNTPAAASWKLRMRTRDLLNVMNCVQCNLCRLHGKISALGLAASLQVLLGIQGRGEEGCNRPPDPTSLRARSRTHSHVPAEPLRSSRRTRQPVLRLPRTR